MRKIEHVNGVHSSETITYVTLYCTDNNESSSTIVYWGALLTSYSAIGTTTILDQIITAVVDKDFFSLFHLPVRNDTDVFDSSFVAPHMESGASLI